MFFKRSNKKLSRKNRNIISGLLVGLASIYAVAAYVDMPREDLHTFLLTTIVFVLGIILLAVVGVLVLKTLGKLKASFFKEK